MASEVAFDKISLFQVSVSVGLVLAVADDFIVMDECMNEVMMHVWWCYIPYFLEYLPRGIT